jgi:hypothetical protein
MPAGTASAGRVELLLTDLGVGLDDDEARLEAFDVKPRECLWLAKLYIHRHEVEFRDRFKNITNRIGHLELFVRAPIDGLLGLWFSQRRNLGPCSTRAARAPHHVDDFVVPPKLTRPFDSARFHN